MIIDVSMILCRSKRSSPFFVILLGRLLASDEISKTYAYHFFDFSGIGVGLP